MARIVGVNIPDNKKIKVALTYIYGIGQKSALDILKALKIDPEVRTKELTPDQISAIQNYIEKNYVVEGYLRQEIRENIRRLKYIRCYRGVRHIIGLPVRGQRTRHNAHTVKGHGKPVGGLKIKLQKK